MSSSDGISSQRELSSEHLNDVRDILRRPLSERTVLVPVGSKAFFPGTLQPTVDSSGQERVVVRLQDGSEKDMSRQEALDILQREIDGKEARKQPSKKVEMKPSPSPQSASSSTDRTDSSLPYFEIREQLDESGKTISGEAVNVTQQLEYLENNGETKSAVADSVPRAKNEEAHGETIPEETYAPKPLSDQEYESLSARLEELACLEEEADQQKASNKKSARQLQSRGWSKGFLNSKPKQKKPKPQTSPSGVRQEKHPPSSRVPRAHSTGRKVAFQEENQVKEIPRVGERSVNEIRTPTESSVFSGLLHERPTRPGPREQDNHAVGQERPTRPAASKPIDDSVLSGVVHERPAKTRSQPQEAPSKKRLSRFAQERQQYR